MSAPLLPLLLLLLASGTLSGAEAALFRLRGAHGGASGRLPWAAEALLRDPVGALTVILFANLLVNLAWFQTAGTWALSDPALPSAGIQLGALLVLLLCGEILPKIAAEARPARLGQILLPPVWLLHRLFGRPARALGEWLAPRRAGDAPDESEVLDAEAADMLLRTAATGILPDSERHLLHQVLEFGRLRAGALRRPLADCPRVRLQDSLDAAWEEMRRHGTAWAVVLEPDGQVAGAVDGLHAPSSGSVRDHLRPVPVLPDLAPVAQGIRLLGSAGAPFVSLVDEYGSPSGIIERGRWADTLLDKLPDTPAGQLPPIVPLGRERWLVDATLPLHVFAERFGDPGSVDVRVETLGGLLQERLGRVPRIGDRTRLGGIHGGWELIVVRADGRRPAEIEVRRLPRNDGTPRTHPRAGTE